VKPIVIHSEAMAELDHAIAYYEERKMGLGLDLLAEIEQATHKIQQNPNIGTIYQNLDVRCYVIKRFPFLIFYAEFSDVLWVIAIAHGKRKPDYWQRRQLE
jgi:toxin ParE1/3/4